MISSIQRYPEAFKISQCTLDYCQCSAYPLDIEKIITDYKEARIIVISETLYKQFRLETHQTKPYLKIKDGRTYYDPKRDIYTIVYNDSLPLTRIRFTLAHEFAHIVLNHLSDTRTEINRGGLPDSVYYAYEGEANAFAGNFLVPPIILDDRSSGRLEKAQTIATAFNVSRQSVVDFRIIDYKYWKRLKTSTEEFRILRRYRRRFRLHLCRQCNALFSIRKSNYCPICGLRTKLITPGDDEFIGKIYPSIDTDEKGRALECPCCENQQLYNEGEYCIVCGVTLINRCADTNKYDSDSDEYYRKDACNHGEILPGNARYCPYCGNETTYFQQGFLQPYNKESSVPLFSESGLDLADDELPFMSLPI